MTSPNRIALIVQARMGSTRLPGKVLKSIGGRPMLSYQIERLRAVRLAQRIVVATTVNAGDDIIEEFCKDEGMNCARGSEHDVLSRYCEAALRFGADIVVRITADCPLIDPGLIDSAIEMFLDSSERCDYLSNMLEPSWPYGMAVEVMTLRALSEANSESADAREREHVTPFIYWRPQRYRLKSMTRAPNLSHHRWTVDTPEDFELVARIVQALYPMKPGFNLNDVTELLGKYPEWESLNRHIHQNIVARTQTGAKNAV
jgi:spore coat polysaccharide biosynthesis protein SpsF